jgi:hypothetical protein
MSSKQNVLWRRQPSANTLSYIFNTGPNYLSEKNVALDSSSVFSPHYSINQV